MVADANAPVMFTSLSAPAVHFFVEKFTTVGCTVVDFFDWKAVTPEVCVVSRRSCYSFQPDSRWYQFGTERLVRRVAELGNRLHIGEHFELVGELDCGIDFKESVVLLSTPLFIPAESDGCRGQSTIEFARRQAHHFECEIKTSIVRPGRNGYFTVTSAEENAILTTYWGDCVTGGSVKAGLAAIDGSLFKFRKTFLPGGTEKLRMILSPGCPGFYVAGAPSHGEANAFLQENQQRFASYGVLNLVALFDIPAGEEVCIDYSAMFVISRAGTTVLSSPSMKVNPKTSMLKPNSNESEWSSLSDEDDLPANG